MNISLDYDNTYTRDPVFWDTFIGTAKRHGHRIYCVTMRTRAEGTEVEKYLADKVEMIIYTARENKHDVCFRMHVSIDVWIDDMPWFINNNAKDFYASGTDPERSED